MDKNKNRTDLLAAGRKRLQQFRNKKDSKGSKTSKKAGEADHGADSSPAASESVVVAQVPDGEPLTHGTDLASTIRSPSENPETDFVNASPIPAETQELVSCKGESMCTSAPVAIGQLSGLPDSSNLVEPVSSAIQVEHIHGKDQVTDVGTMQEAEVDLPNQVDICRRIEVRDVGVETNSNPPSVYMGGEMDTREVKKASESDDVSSRHLSGVVKAIQVEDGQSLSVVPVHDVKGILDGGPGVIDQNQNMMSGLSNQCNAAISFCHEERVQMDNHDATTNVEKSLISMGDSVGNSLQSKVVSLSREQLPGAQLIHAGGFSTLDSDIFNVIERLKEELYLAHFEKDIFQLQLVEPWNFSMEFNPQCLQLVNAMSINSDLLHDTGFEKESFAERKSELQVAFCGREDAQEKLGTAMAEIEDFSAKIDELQSELEKSHGDLLKLSTELVECRNSVAALQVENENLNWSVNGLTEDTEKLKGEKGELLLQNEKVTAELADCRALLATLQLENVNLSGALDSLSEERSKLEHEKEYFSCENDRLFISLAEAKKEHEAERDTSISETKKLSSELASCKNFVDALQAEISGLNQNFVFERDEKKRLEEEKSHLITDSNTRLRDLEDCRCLITGLQVECNKAKEDLKEAIMCLEQSIEEIFFLKSNLEIYETKMKELNDKNATVPSEEVQGTGSDIDGSDAMCKGSATQVNNSRFADRKREDEGLSPQIGKYLSCDVGEPALLQPKVHAMGDLHGIFSSKKHLVEIEKVLEKLEKAIEGMHCHTASLSRPVDKVAAPAISKLIQAFESKAYYSTDCSSEEMCSIDAKSIEDPSILSKEQIRKLRDVFQEFVCDIETASKSFEGGRNCCSRVDVEFGELKCHHENLELYANKLEGANIQYMVLYEAIKQHLSDVEADKGNLILICETLKKKKVYLESENSKLSSSVTACLSRISNLHNHLVQMCQRSDEIVSSIHDQVDTRHKEVVDNISVLEQQWNSIVAWIILAVGQLNESIGIPTPTFRVPGHHGDPDLFSQVSFSIDAAIQVIDDTRKELVIAKGDHHAICSSYDEMKEKFNDLLRHDELATSMLHRIYIDLSTLVFHYCRYSEETKSGEENEKLQDPLCHNEFDILIKELEKFLQERLQLESMNKKLNLELIDKVRDVSRFTTTCLDPDAIIKLIEDVESVVKPEDVPINADEPAIRLQFLVSFLVQRFKKADELASLSREQMGLRETEVTELQGQVDSVDLLLIQHENEIVVLTESLRRLQEKLLDVQSEVQEKAVELGQSEQRVSSLREKLSIAVTKGKGLIVQRDGLNKSLAEMSSEVHKYTQELQAKDAKLLEVEAKLKTYSEAGDRVDALESELSYIRTSASAMRESFLLKDSLIQRIEEILEGLELPDHFHSRDIIEKIDWLARAVSQNALPFAEWDQKNSVAGDSCSDSGIMVMDAWKEDLQPNSALGDDLLKKYEDLRGKLYGLAEENEMLEQSLMERNNVIQRVEEILDRINMPSQFRSLEPEARIKWLGNELSEALDHSNTLQQRIDSFEIFCGSVSADLEESRERISDLEANLRSVLREKEQLSRRFETLAGDYDRMSQEAAQFATDNAKLRNEEATLQAVIFEKETLSKNLEPLTLDYDRNCKMNESLQNEIDVLQEKLDLMLVTVERIQQLEGDIRRLQQLVNEVLQDPSAEDLSIGCSDVEYLEQLLRKLIEKYALFSTSREPVIKDTFDEHIFAKVDAHIHGIPMPITSIEDLNRDSKGTSADMIHLMEEREKYMEINESLTREIEVLEGKRKELQELLCQEEQRSVSVREKLNVAVRKGKLLVQQRDSMKQVIEDLQMKMEHLKAELKLREDAISEYEQKIADIATCEKRVEATESEILFLRNHLTEAEHELQEKGHTLSMIISSLDSIDVGCKFSVTDPLEMVNEISKLCRVLQAAMIDADNESKKSKRAADLLLAELNEVQERNDILQEELAAIADKLCTVLELDSADTAKLGAHALLEQFSAARAEERKRHNAESMTLKSVLHQLRKDILVVDKLQDDILTHDLEFLHNLQGCMMSCLEPSDAPFHLIDLPITTDSGGECSKNLENEENFPLKDMFPGTNSADVSHDNSFAEICTYFGHQLQYFTLEISSLREKLYTHSVSCYKEAKQLSEVAKNIYRQMISQKESLKSMKAEANHLLSIEKEKDNEMFALQRNFSLLYEACTNSVLELEKWKVKFVGNDPFPESSISVERKDVSGAKNVYTSEDCVKSMADKLSSGITDLVNMHYQSAEGGLKEMESNMSNLQKELHDKDIQNERICMELVTQIKEAEAAASSYLQDLEHAQHRVCDLERLLEEMKTERGVWNEKLKMLQEREAILIEVQERVKSLANEVAGKDQEIEELMQALDEEEVQMEKLNDKVLELEKVLQQKNVDFEKLEASHKKSLKKLSVTVNKFDELHHFSASLLSEVERLQSQLQDRNEEISFLRQEVTRCTNDALTASQTSNKRSSDDILDLLAWLDAVVSQVQACVAPSLVERQNQFDEHKEMLQKQIVAIVTELQDLRSVTESKDSLLEAERKRVEDLLHKSELLENSLLEKESQLSMRRGVGVSGMSKNSSEIMEVEHVSNNWVKPGTSLLPQVRSLRKANNDQVSIAVDTDVDAGDRVDDEDDDKAHGFKSLTTSRIVPRFTRPVTDMIDGLWVSCDRALMRQPALRLGVIVYWAVMHALLAAFVV